MFFFSLFILVCVFVLLLNLPPPAPPVKSGDGGGGIREVQSNEKCGGAFFLTERSLDFPGVTLPFMHNSGFVITENASKCQVTKDDRKTY